MQKHAHSVLLFDSVSVAERQGEFQRWMLHQKIENLSGHTIITTFDINYNFVSQALSGLFFNKHECTILRSGFARVPEDGNDLTLSNINIYPYLKNRQTHVKILISVNERCEYFIAIGSANATYGGLGGYNLEFIEIFSNSKLFKKNKGIETVNLPTKDYLTSLLEHLKAEFGGNVKLPVKNLNKIIDRLKKVKCSSSNWPKIIDNRKANLFEQMFKGKRNIDNFYIMSPYHGVTDNVFKRFVKKTIWILPDNCRILKGAKKNYNFCSLANTDKPLHAKAYLIKRKSNHWIYYGSANCTKNALFKTVKDKNRQLEMLLYRKISAKSYQYFCSYCGEPFQPEITTHIEEYPEIENHQLFCINIFTGKNKNRIIFITANQKLPPNASIKISFDKSHIFKLSSNKLNKQIAISAIGKTLCKFFEEKRPKFIFQKTNRKYLPVPVNYEGTVTYSEDSFALDLEDEIICCFSGVKIKKKKGDRNQKSKEHELFDNTLTHESDLDIWFKKVKRIKEIRDKNRKSDALEDIQEYINLLIKNYRKTEKYKYKFLENFLGDGN